jgi:hypothetical protein
MSSSGPRKKQRVRGLRYQVNSPNLRGNRSSPAGTQLEKDAFLIYCAVANAYHASQGSSKRSSVAGIYSSDSRTKATWFNTAQNALTSWEQNNAVPRLAIQYFKEHEAKIWPKIPFVNLAVAQSFVEDQEAESFRPCDEDELPLELTDQNHENWETPADEVVVVEGLAGNLASQEEVRRRICDLMSIATISFLTNSNRKVIRLTFRRILQHWAVDCRIAQEHLTKLLKLLKKHKPDLRAELEKLPSTGKSLLKLSAEDLDSVRRHSVYNRSDELAGTYMHYGIIDGVLGNSAGSYFKHF